MGLTNFTSDIELKGETWRFIINKLVGIQNESTNKEDSFKIFETYYQVFYLCASIGIMYDKQLDIGNDYGHPEKSLFVPRNVLHRNRNDLEFLLTTAVISSKQIDYTIDERLMIAFDEKETSFRPIKFLEGFANYGAEILKNEITNHDLETMENINEFLKKAVESSLTENIEIDIDYID